MDGTFFEPCITRSWCMESTVKPLHIYRQQTKGQRKMTALWRCLYIEAARDYMISGQPSEMAVTYLQYVSVLCTCRYL